MVETSANSTERGEVDRSLLDASLGCLARVALGPSPSSVAALGHRAAARLARRQTPVRLLSRAASDEAVR